MNIVTKKISDLTLNKKNPRVNDAAAERLVKGIEKYGFVNPVIANKDGLILAGHTRIKALKKMGQKTVPVLYVDMDEATAKGFSIYDNKSAEFSGWDDELLESEIKELMDMDFDISMTGFDPADFGLGIDETGFPELKTGDKEPFQQMTFTLSDEQAESVKEAITKSKDMGPFVSDNENSNGNAFARVCEAFNG